MRQKILYSKVCPLRHIKVSEHNAISWNSYVYIENENEALVSKMDLYSNKTKILKVLLREQSKLLFQIKKSLNPVNLEKIRKNPEKNPEKSGNWMKFRIKKIIRSNLRSKALIV